MATERRDDRDGVQTMRQEPVPLREEAVVTDHLDRAVPIADTVPHPWPTPPEAVEQLLACGLSVEEVAVYLRLRAEVESLPERLAKAVN